MTLISTAQKFVEYSGCALFFLHMFNNRFRLSKLTGVFIVGPPLLSYLVKVCGYWWVDHRVERAGLYKVYRIREEW